MNTKYLSGTLALLGASLLASRGQVNSVNAVGYVTLSLPAGLSLIANPLNHPNTHLDTILPLPDSADGTVIFRLDPATQSYRDAVTFFAGFGWYAVSGDPHDPVLTIDPGEGFFIQPAGPTPLDVTLVGEVPQGNLTNPIPANCSLKSSQVPQAGRLATYLEFRPVAGDVIRRWDAFAQVFQPVSTYAATGTWDPEEPTIQVAEGFLVCRNPALATPDKWWIRAFWVIPLPPPGAWPSGPAPSPLRIRALGVSAAQVSLDIINPNAATYAVQFSTDGLAWKTVAENQTTTLWTAPRPSGTRGLYRLVNP